MNESVLLSADEQTLRIKKSMDTKTIWYMTKFRLLKHRGCNLIGHRLSCKNSCHRSLDTRRQCDLPSKSMYHCRLSQTLMRKIWCLMFDETIYKVPKKSFCIKIEINCFESDICMVSHDNFFIFSVILTSAWNIAQRTGDKDQETEKMNFLLWTNIGRHQSQHSFTLTLSLPQQLPAEVK